MRLLNGTKRKVAHENNLLKSNNEKLTLSLPVFTNDLIHITYSIAQVEDFSTDPYIYSNGTTSHRYWINPVSGRSTFSSGVAIQNTFINGVGASNNTDLRGHKGDEIKVIAKANSDFTLTELGALFTARFNGAMKELEVTGTTNETFKFFEGNGLISTGDNGRVVSRISDLGLIHINNTMIVRR